MKITISTMLFILAFSLFAMAQTPMPAVSPSPAASPTPALMPTPALSPTNTTDSPKRPPVFKANKDSLTNEN